MTVSIMLADEADLVLIGAQTILKDRLDFEVIHSARGGDDLLNAARRCLPEVILFNERLDPLIDLLALVERLKHAAPDARLLMLGGTGRWTTGAGFVRLWGAGPSLQRRRST